MKTLIYGGRLIDPANRVDALLNILLENGKVAWVGTGMPEAEETIDATGKLVTPGFVDIHMHEDPVENGKIDYSIFNFMLNMGVTTAVGGNCGISVYDPTEYLTLVDRDGAPVNVALFAGHEYFRNAAGATDKYARATEEQRVAMTRGIQKALDDGCVGVSFGLRYIPGTDEDEFMRAAKCCVSSGKLISSHVRDDAAGVFGAIEEFVRAGEELKIPVQVSHIGSMAGFGQMAQVLRILDAKAMNGLDVMLDCYPYAAFSTKVGSTTYDPGWLERYNADYDVLEFCEGKYKGQRATKETFEEMRRDFPECLTVCYVMKPEDIALAYRHPRVMVGSDGIMSHGQGHPRAAGSFPRFLAEYARQGIVDWYTAVEMITATPANRLHLTAKGRLNVGADGDVVIFDPEKLRDRATFAEPTLPPDGIDYVILGGEIAVRNSKILKSNCGKAVRR